MLKTEGREALLELLDQGWNQSRLARRIGVSQPAVCAWLAMRARPNVRTQLALQRAFGIPLSAWLTAEEEVAMSNERAQLEQSVAGKLREMGDIELRVLAMIQSRMLAGQKQYGKFQRGDRRNWTREALEEVCDTCVYLSLELDSQCD